MQNSQLNTLYNNTVCNITGNAIVANFNTDSLIIDNKVFNNTQMGIFLNDCQNLTIKDNTFSRNEQNGVYLYLSNNLTISKNIIFGNDRISSNIWRGIMLYGSFNNTISFNTVYNNSYYGIQLTASSYDNIIDNNEIFNHTYDGIWVTSSSVKNNFTRNRIYNNSINGISLYGSSNYSYISGNFFDFNANGILVSTNNNTIVNNEISNQTNTGITVQGHNNTFSKNKIVNNTSYAILAQNGMNNTITGNDFFNSKLTPTSSQVCDHNSPGSNNISFNYYNDWTNPDNNLDGYVDYHYMINGTAGNNDPFPLANSAFIDHEIVNLTLTYPNGGIFVTGVITITWLIGYENCTWGHTIEFFLDYSDDGGSTWYALAKNLTTMSHNWNTITVPDGSNYLIRVVAICQGHFSTEDVSDDVFTISNTIHSILDLKVVYPNGGETVSGNITVEWSIGYENCTWGHTIEFFLYYSDDGGSTWTVLASNLKDLKYEWDTTTVSNGNDYVILVKAVCQEGIISEDKSDDVFTIDNGSGSVTNLTFCLFLASISIIVCLKKYRKK